MEAVLPDIRVSWIDVFFFFGHHRLDSGQGKESG